jgi:hypothetical protein
MTLSIQNDAGAEGHGDTVDPATVQINLGQITRDLNIGQGTTTADLVQVTYTGAGADAPAQRISTLVNTNFNVNAGTPDIVILGTGPNFTLLDGTTMCGNGLTLAPTAIPASPGQNNPDNPTKSIYVVYDKTLGDGHTLLVRQPGGSTDQNTYSAPTPGSVALFHELSHAFRLAQAKGVFGVPPQAADDEVLAINDENVLRPILGIPLRDPNPPHDAKVANCGGGGCCIVASIATGSPYSEEVNALRLVRDRTLRNSDIGYDFFQRLWDDYYAFSPEVCRLMARSPNLLVRVRLCFVGPLSRILRLAYDHATAGSSGERLGRAFEDGVAESELASLRNEDLHDAEVLLGCVQDADSPMSPLLAEFAAYLGETARRSPFVRWALVEPIVIYVRALRWRLERVPTAELGDRLARALEDWGARLPLTDAWHGLSDVGLLRELEFLKRVLLPSAAARARLARRLLALTRDEAHEAQRSEPSFSGEFEGVSPSRDEARMRAALYETSYLDREEQAS